MVDGHEFRWRATGNDGWISIIIWPTENDDSRVIGDVGYHHLWRDNDDGSKSSIGQVVVTNRMIRKIIEYIGPETIVSHKGQMNIGAIEDVFDVREAVRSEDVKQERASMEE